MIPLYGFVQGDTIGLVVLADEKETVGEVARRLSASASLRVPPWPDVEILHDGRVLDPRWTVEAAKLSPLDRFDVVPSKGAGP